MSLADIHTFLMRRGALAFRYLADTDGVVKTPAEIIHRVAATWSISPKFLLTLLQREQSIVEDPAPTQGQFDWATGFAVCDSCSTDDPDVAAWRGFANQVEGAARQIRNRYLPDLAAKGVTVSGIGPGIPRVIDGVTVVPSNDATAVLYTYTPHLQGNLNFAKIWQRWFSLSHPDGTVVKRAAKPDVWLIQDGEKRRFASRSAFLTRFRDADVVVASDAERATVTFSVFVYGASAEIDTAPVGTSTSTVWLRVAVVAENVSPKDVAVASTEMENEVSEFHVCPTTVRPVPERVTAPSERKPVPVRATENPVEPWLIVVGETEVTVGLG